MATKIKLTRPELKRFRDALARFERYLPMLKLKQQQLQMTLRDVQKKREEALADAEEAQKRVDQYRSLLSEHAGVNITKLAEPEKIETSMQNVAGVNVPVFKSVKFMAVAYSLFATPVWVDKTVQDQRDMRKHTARAEVLEEQYRLLSRELVKIIQRVNLFEKVKIPEAKEAIRVIRIKLGDEMTSAVGRGKIAKAKLTRDESTVYDSDATTDHGEMSEEVSES
jgi:V/A-type H+-transporting ATPase subunit D